MNCRDLLKFGGVTTLLLLFPTWKLAELAFAFPESEFKGRFYRGTPNGDIQISHDQKQSWQNQVGFGSDFAVKKMFTRADGHLAIEVEYLDWRFNLSLSDDERNWLVD